jgi:hypothetical protein
LIKSQTAASDVPEQDLDGLRFWPHGCGTPFAAPYSVLHLGSLSIVSASIAQRLWQTQLRVNRRNWIEREEATMKFGIVGLGRIGEGLVLQSLEKGHHPVGFNRSPETTRSLAKQGLEPAFSHAELVSKLDPPRTIFIYVPQGEPTGQVISGLRGLLQSGDVLAEGGNSHWKDSVRHHEELKAVGTEFLDIGTSGGVEGARHGACFMVGGDKRVFVKTEPLLRDLAVADGVTYAGREKSTAPVFGPPKGGENDKSSEPASKS